MGRSTGSSQALLDLENNSQNSELALLVCKNANNDLLKKKKLETAKAKSNAPPVTKPTITAPPRSQVMGKLKDFLGIMAESNKKLQQDAMKSKNYDIEALTGDESEYIEMDLMLGVADLNTPEAVAAAESAIVGSQAVISLDTSSTESDTEDSSDDDSCSESGDESNKSKCFSVKSKGQKLEKSTNAISENDQRRKRPKIVELL